MATEPARGIDGTYAGTCAACLTPTDTALAFEGDAAAHMTFLLLLGIPTDEDAAEALETAMGAVPAGVFGKGYRLCSACATAHGLPVAPALVMDGAQLPTLRLR